MDPWTAKLVKAKLLELKNIWTRCSILVKFQYVEKSMPNCGNCLEFNMYVLCKLWKKNAFLLAGSDLVGVNQIDVD